MTAALVDVVDVVDVEVDVALAVEREPAVMLCLFRTCVWTSPEIQTAPQEVCEVLMTRHLLREHPDALHVLGELARNAGLL